MKTDTIPFPYIVDPSQRVFTTYLGEQLTSEPDRVRVEFEDDGEVANVYVDGLAIQFPDDFAAELGAFEADRIAMEAIEHASGKHWSQVGS